MGVKIRTKSDIVIPAGTEFECIDGTKREYLQGNYETVIALDEDCKNYLSVIINESEGKLGAIDVEFVRG